MKRRFFLVAAGFCVSSSLLNAEFVSHPLYEAVDANNVKKVTSLLKNPENRKVLNDPPASYAAMAKESNDPTDGRITARARSSFMLDMLIKNGLKITPADGWSICTVIENGYSYHEQSFRIVRLLIDKGANVNFVHPNHKLTPLHYSVKYNTFKITKLLIDKGANVNARDREGATPLHGLLANFDHETRFVRPKGKLLVSKGADVNARDNKGATPLMYAVREIVEEPIYVLVSLGADVNARDNDGFTALHYTAFSSNSKKVAFLLKHGADKKAKTKDGKTAGDLLREQMSSYTEYGKQDILYKEMEKMLAMLE